MRISAPRRLRWRFCISTAAAGRLQQSAATCCDNCICICIRSPAAAYSYANIRNIRTSASSPPLSFCIILRRRSPFFMGTQAKFGNFFACFFFCSEHVRKHLNQLCSNLQRGLQLEGEGVAVCGSNCYVKYEHARRINNASCQRMQNIFLVSRFSRDPGILVSGWGKPFQEDPLSGSGLSNQLVAGELCCI